jgi:hypothetical protein
MNWKQNQLSSLWYWAVTCLQYQSHNMHFIFENYMWKYYILWWCLFQDMILLWLLWCLVYDWVNNYYTCIILYLVDPLVHVDGVAISVKIYNFEDFFFNYFCWSMKIYRWRKKGHDLLYIFRPPSICSFTIPGRIFHLESDFVCMYCILEFQLVMYHICLTSIHIFERTRMAQWVR